MKCNICEIEKPEEEFNFKNKSKGVKQGKCKNCTKIYRKQYYDDNKNAALSYATKSNKNIRLRNQQYLWDNLKNNSCVDCGNDNPIVLEFDHLDVENKVIDVSTAARNGWSLENIQKEIDKCEIRCANCHRIKTYHQFNWLKDVIK